MSKRFVKADLHIHTPYSECCDESSTSEQIIEAMVLAGLEVVAITDHNSFEGVQAIGETGRRNGITVFPGIELSARGGHVIGLFDPDTPAERLALFLERVGVVPEAIGDATYTVGWIEDIFETIAEWGGVAVAAHIERWPSGFLETNERRHVKWRIHASRHLSALEITQPHNRELWREGSMGGYPKKYACIQGSDSHALKDIGRRYVYLDLPSFDINGLRTAFKEYRSRIRFPEDD